MKNYDRVKLIKDRALYTERGIHKGAVGTIMMDDVRNGYVLVYFDGEYYINEYGFRIMSETPIGVRVEDLEVISD